MASFRRLVIGVAEFLLVVSMIVFTFVSGVAGAALGSIYFAGLNTTTVHLANFGSASVATVVGFFLGALIGFTVTCSSAAFLFAIAQIERNTRPLEVEYVQDNRYRGAPRF